LIGLDTLLLLMLRLITLDEAMGRVRRKLNISGRHSVPMLKWAWI
jgi:hypothetical protein